jgi:hypothetical protein
MYTVQSAIGGQVLFTRVRRLPSTKHWAAHHIYGFEIVAHVRETTRGSRNMAEEASSALTFFFLDGRNSVHRKNAKHIFAHILPAAGLFFFVCYFGSFEHIFRELPRLFPATSQDK